MAMALTVLVVLIALAIFLALAVSLLEALVTLIARVLATASLAAIAGLATGLITEARWPGAGAPAGLLVTLVSLVPIGLVVWRLTFSQTTAPGRKGGPLTPGASGDAREGTMPDVAFPQRDHALGLAWERAGEIAPTHARELQQGRNRCARLLTLERTSATLDPEIIETCTLIRRHVPPLVEETARACRTASSAEAAGLSASLVSKLQALAIRAARLTEQLDLAAREDLAIRHAHLDNQLRAMDGGPLQTRSVAQSEKKRVPLGWTARLAKPFALWR
jgi:hypothetical protein